MQLQWYTFIREWKISSLVSKRQITFSWQKRTHPLIDMTWHQDHRVQYLELLEDSEVIQVSWCTQEHTSVLYIVPCSSQLIRFDSFVRRSHIIKSINQSRIRTLVLPRTKTKNKSNRICQWHITKLLFNNQLYYITHHVTTYIADWAKSDIQQSEHESSWL